MSTNSLDINVSFSIEILGLLHLCVVQPTAAAEGYSLHLCVAIEDNPLHLEFSIVVVKLVLSGTVLMKSVHGDGVQRANVAPLCCLCWCLAWSSPAF